MSGLEELEAARQDATAWMALERERDHAHDLLVAIRDAYDVAVRLSEGREQAFAMQQERAREVASLERMVYRLRGQIEGTRFSPEGGIAPEATPEHAPCDDALLGDSNPASVPIRWRYGRLWRR